MCFCRWRAVPQDRKRSAVSVYRSAARAVHTRVLNRKRPSLRRLLRDTEHERRVPRTWRIISPMAKTADIDIRGPKVARSDQILTPSAIEFLRRLHKEFEPRRRQLLERREEIQEQILNEQQLPAFPGYTKKIRAPDCLDGPHPQPRV